MAFSGWVHIDVDEITQETEKAFCCLIDGETHWLPKSQIADHGDYGMGDKNISMSITEWIAKEKGFDV